MSSKNNKKGKKQPSVGTVSVAKENASVFKNKQLIGMVIIVAAVFICYLPLFHNGFVNWDDPEYIYESQLIKSINLKAFFSQFMIGNYQPLVLTVYAFIYNLFGIAPGAYHAVSLLFHMLNTLLVMVVIINLIGSFELAFIVSLLFGIHPMHVESVAWASELKDLMYTFFFLLALWQYVLYVKSKEQKYYRLALLFFVCSVLSKAMGVSLVAVLFLVDFFVQRRFNARTWLEKIPFFVIGLIIGYVAIIAQHHAGAIAETARFSFLQRLTFACYGFITYIQRTLVPVNLTAYYPYPLKTGDGIPGLYYVYPFLFAAVAGCTLYTLKFTRRIFFAVAFFGVTVFLVLQLLPVGDAVTADRYNYIPSIGIFLLIAYGLMFLSEKLSGKIIPSVILICITLWYGAAAFSQVHIWKDNMSLWTDIINKSKYVQVAYEGRGATRFMNNDYYGAAEDYSKAIELNNKNAETYYDRGTALNKLEDYAGAVRDFTKALDLDPKYIGAYINRGIARQNMKDYAGAIEDFTTVIELRPNSDNYFNRGASKQSFKDYKGAIGDFTTAIELDPKNIRAYYSRGVVRYDLNDFTGAIADYCKTIELDPANINAYNNRGNAKENLQDHKGAIEDYSKAIELDPSHINSYNNRGAAKDNLKDYAGAIQDFTKAIELNPNNANAYFNRGQAKIMSGDKNGGCTDLDKAGGLGMKVPGDVMNKYCR